MATPGAIAAPLRTKLDEEARLDFPSLRRIPSTGIIKFLDYFSALPPTQRDPLLDAIARVGAMQFFPPVEIAAEHERLRTGDPAYARYMAALHSPAFGYGLRYCDIKMARMMLDDQQSVDQMKKMRADLDFTPRDDPPAELVADPDLRHAHPAKAPLLSKLVKEALANLLSSSTKPARLPGGEMKFSGTLQNIPLTVSIDFGSRIAQLRYGVSAPVAGKNLRAFNLTYEVLWSASTGWDYLTEENAAASIELLCDRLRFLARLLEEIAALPEH